MGVIGLKSSHWGGRLPQNEILLQYGAYLVVMAVTYSAGERGLDDTQVSHHTTSQKLPSAGVHVSKSSTSYENVPSLGQSAHTKSTTS